MEDAGVIGLADELGMKLFYWHVMDSGKDSVDLLRRLLDRFGTGLQYVLVRNQVRGADFSGLEQSGEQARAIGMGANIVSVKKLNEHVIQKIDAASSSFWQAKASDKDCDRPRPDGPPARQDVAARRLPRNRRSRRLSRGRVTLRRAGASVSGAAAAVAAAMARERRRAPPTSARFALGVASGQPRADGMVLWTRLTGERLPERVTVRWEVADDEAFQRVVARGEETPKRPGRTASTPSRVGLEPARWYWYRFSALGERARSAAPAPRRPPMPRRRCASRSPAASATTSATTPPGATSPAPASTWCCSSATTSTSTRPARTRCAASRAARRSRSTQYRARYATTRATRRCRPRTRRAPWLLVWDDHEVSNDYAGLRGEDLARRLARAPRRRLSRLLGAHAVPEVGAAGRRRHAHRRPARLGPARAHPPARRPPVPRSAGLPEARTAAARTRWRCAQCPALLDPARTLLGARAGAMARRRLGPRPAWNLLAQQTLMARFTWLDPAIGGGVYWTDGWDGYAPARNRLLGTVAAKKVPGVVVLGGDVHSNYVADLKADYDDPAAPVVASEFCGTSITSLSVAQARIDVAREYNPHIRYGRADQRGYMRFELDATAAARAASQVVERPVDPASAVTTAARFVVDAARPGPIAA